MPLLDEDVRGRDSILKFGTALLDPAVATSLAHPKPTSKSAAAP